MTTLADIRAKRTELEAIGKKYGVSNIRVFGSVARGDATPESDVDLLVAFDSERYTGFDLGGFQQRASDLLGCRVDIVMDHHIYPSLAPHILHDARPL